MTNTVLLRRDDEKFDERTDVQYAEEAVRGRDNQSGVAVQYEDEKTEFIVDAEIVGVYPTGVFDPLTKEFEGLVNGESRQ
jgi:hypothetical protein